MTWVTVCFMSLFNVCYLITSGADGQGPRDLSYRRTSQSSGGRNSDGRDDGLVEVELLE